MRWLMLSRWSAWGRHESRLGNWASILGIAVPTAGFVASYLVSDSMRETVLASGITIGMLAAGCWFLNRSARLGRQSRYVEVLPNIHEAVRRITLETLAEFHSVGDKRQVLTRVMDDVARAFSNHRLELPGVHEGCNSKWTRSLCPNIVTEYRSHRDRRPTSVGSQHGL
jgi:hypothetical protein